MEGIPDKGRDTTRQGRAHGPDGRNLLTGGFRVPPFSPERNRLYVEATRRIQQCQRVGIGEYGVCWGVGTSARFGEILELVDVDDSSIRTPDGFELLQEVGRGPILDSPPSASGSGGASGASGTRPREARGTGPSGPRAREARRRGAANDDGGKPQRRLSVRPAGGGRRR